MLMLEASALLSNAGLKQLLLRVNPPFSCLIDRWLTTGQFKHAIVQLCIWAIGENSSLYSMWCFYTLFYIFSFTFYCLYNFLYKQEEDYFGNHCSCRIAAQWWNWGPTETLTTVFVDIDQTVLCRPFYDFALSALCNICIVFVLCIIVFTRASNAS